MGSSLAICWASSFPACRVPCQYRQPRSGAKVRRLVEGYAATFEKDRNPYASPKASETWACYVLDKYEIGLLDAASLAGVESARALLPRVIEAGLRFIPDHTFDRVGTQKPPYDEPYILSENLFRTWELTGRQRFFDLGKRYLLDDGFFNRSPKAGISCPGSTATATSWP